MDTFNLEDMLSLISADASSIQTLSLEVSEMVEPNSSDYFKLHALYVLTEDQIRQTERIEDELVKLRRFLQ